MGDVALHTSPGSTKAFGDPLGEGLPASVRTPPSQQRIRAMPSPPPPSPHRCTRKSPRNPHSASPSVRRGAQGNPYPFLPNVRFLQACPPTFPTRVILQRWPSRFYSSSRPVVAAYAASRRQIRADFAKPLGARYSRFPSCRARRKIGVAEIKSAFASRSSSRFRHNFAWINCLHVAFAERIATAELSKTSLLSARSLFAARNNSSMSGSCFLIPATKSHVK